MAEQEREHAEALARDNDFIEMIERPSSITDDLNELTGQDTWRVRLAALEFRTYFERANRLDVDALRSFDSRASETLGEAMSGIADRLFSGNYSLSDLWQSAVILTNPNAAEKQGLGEQVAELSIAVQARIAHITDVVLPQTGAQLPFAAQVLFTRRLLQYAPSRDTIVAASRRLTQLARVPQSAAGLVGREADVHRIVSHYGNNWGQIADSLTRYFYQEPAVVAPAVAPDRKKSRAQEKYEARELERQYAEALDGSFVDTVYSPSLQASMNEALTTGDPKKCAETLCAIRMRGLGKGVVLAGRQGKELRDLAYTYVAESKGLFINPYYVPTVLLLTALDAYNDRKQEVLDPAEIAELLRGYATASGIALTGPSKSGKDWHANSKVVVLLGEAFLFQRIHELNTLEIAPDEMLQIAAKRFVGTGGQANMGFITDQLRIASGIRGGAFGRVIGKLRRLR